MATKGVSNPEPGDDVEARHEIDRPERAHLARREIAEHAGAEEKPKGRRTIEKRNPASPEIESAYARYSGYGESHLIANDSRNFPPHFNRDPDIAGNNAAAGTSRDSRQTPAHPT